MPPISDGSQTVDGTLGPPHRRRVAVIGAGIAGLTAAHLLRRSHDVVLFESASRLGGHTHTHLIDEPEGTMAVDSGFIVHNRRTYPLLLRLFDELGIATRPAEMSMSITCDGCGLAYAGGRGIRGVLAQPGRLRDVRFARLLTQVPRFHRAARTLLHTAENAQTPKTYGAWLAEQRFDPYFVSHFAIPLVACVWSSGTSDALAYPARYLFTFLANHGMLTVTRSPQWYTVTGGSNTYVERIAGLLTDVRTGDPVASVTRSRRSAEITTAGGRRSEVDHVVLATHADTALGLLADPSVAEKDVLGAFDYSRNPMVLHTDEGVLPPAPAARASWNYRMPACNPAAGHAPVTYWMNRLQGHDTARQHLVSLNPPPGAVDPATVLVEDCYTHPIFTPASLTAQQRLPELNTPVTTYAGAYHGWGFHEDGCRSGVAAARSLGVQWGSDGARGR